MSDENEDLLAKHIAAKDIRYPIVRATNAAAAYGIRAYPSYFLIAADGSVVTVPADRKPAHDLIERELRNVVLTPKLPDDSFFTPLRRHWEKPDYARIDGFLTKALLDEDLAPEWRSIIEAQRADFDARIAAVERRIGSLAEGPDYWAASHKLEKLADEWAGLAVADRAEEVLDRFKDSPEIKREIGASRALDRLLQRYDRSRIAQRRKLAEALTDFEQRFAGTHAATKAQSIRSSIAN